MSSISSSIPRQLRLQAVSLPLANDSDLMSSDLSFTCLSERQRLLLMTAEDILNGRKSVFLQELIAELDIVRFEGLLLAYFRCLAFERTARGGRLSLSE